MKFALLALATLLTTQTWAMSARDVECIEGFEILSGDGALYNNGAGVTQWAMAAGGKDQTIFKGGTSNWLNEGAFKTRVALKVDYQNQTADITARVLDQDGTVLRELKKTALFEDNGEDFLQAKDKRADVWFTMKQPPMRVEFRDGSPSAFPQMASKGDMNSGHGKLNVLTYGVNCRFK